MTNHWFTGAGTSRSMRTHGTEDLEDILRSPNTPRTKTGQTRKVVRSPDTEDECLRNRIRKKVGMKNPQIELEPERESPVIRLKKTGRRSFSQVETELEEELPQAPAGKAKKSKSHRLTDTEKEDDTEILRLILARKAPIARATKKAPAAEGGPNTDGGRSPNLQQGSETSLLLSPLTQPQFSGQGIELQLPQLGDVQFGDISPLTDSTLRPHDSVSNTQAGPSCPPLRLTNSARTLAGMFVLFKSRARQHLEEQLERSDRERRVARELVTQLEAQRAQAARVMEMLAESVDSIYRMGDEVFSMFDNFVEEITQQLRDKEAQQLREEVRSVDGVEVPTTRATVDTTSEQSWNKKLGDWKGKHPVPGSLGHPPRAGDVVTPAVARAVTFNPVLSTPVGRLGLHYDPNITASVSRLAEARQLGESVVDYERRMNSLRRFSESTSQLGTNSAPTTLRRQHLRFEDTKAKERRTKDSSQNNRSRTEAGGGGGQGGGPPDGGSSHSSGSSSTPSPSDDDETKEDMGEESPLGGILLTEEMTTTTTPRLTWIQMRKGNQRVSVLHQEGGAIGIVTSNIKNLKLPPPRKYGGEDDIEVFKNWLRDLLHWLCLNGLAGPEHDKECILVLGSYLESRAKVWLDEDIDLRGRGLLQFLHKAMAQRAATKYNNCVYDQKEGVAAFFNQLDAAARKLVVYPDDYSFRRKFFFRLPTEIVRPILHFHCMSPEYNMTEQLLSAAIETEASFKTAREHQVHRHVEMKRAKGKGLSKSNDSKDKTPVVPNNTTDNQPRIFLMPKKQGINEGRFFVRREGANVWQGRSKGPVPGQPQGMNRPKGAPNSGPGRATFANPGHFAAACPKPSKQGERGSRAHTPMGRDKTRSTKDEDRGDEHPEHEESTVDQVGIGSEEYEEWIQEEEDHRGWQDQYKSDTASGYWNNFQSGYPDEVEGQYAMRIVGESERKDDELPALMPCSDSDLDSVCTVDETGIRRGVWPCEKKQMRMDRRRHPQDQELGNYRAN
ncbi:hypothetical protein JAAARDRAFT_51767 [Jaapia argillacea MUCL 33604]|uniref:Uncharacterized protein n=1 Tax=Jaapia argillacea MUCL 33604 TaxID=933084 RepID=A0A067PEH2_9AGAM|nr:hypothetical protein JAAARDRAFT_51767 [Jaapia argillacea MUCL 33604]